MAQFSTGIPEGFTPVSIKIRVTSGCFHREHSPEAYRLIDDYLSKADLSDIHYRVEEHESGPEILVYLAVVTASLSLAKSLVELITEIIKARSEGIKRGDRPAEPLEIIVRGHTKDSQYAEEKIVKIPAGTTITAKQLQEVFPSQIQFAPSKTTKERMKIGIFVSYAREDQVPAEALVGFLRAAGFEVWFDKDSLHAGQDWRMVIEQAIASARLLIICLSKNSVDKTGFVQKEMRLALQQAELRPASQVYIIPVSLDGCHLPAVLERLHVLNLTDPNATRRLLDAIGNATSKDAQSPAEAHDALASAIRSYGHQSSSKSSTGPTLSEAAQQFLDLIEQEPDPEKRGIVEIIKEIQPGVTRFFPRIQYSGGPTPMKSRLFRQAVAELISAERLLPPEFNPSTNTRTYEYLVR